MDTGELPVGTIVGPQTITILWDTDDTLERMGYI
jgi:hypothetical protein